MYALRMKTNRVIKRDQAARLDLASRINLEIELTDAEAERIPPKPIPANWQFKDYSQRAPWMAHLFDFLGSLAGRTILDLGCGYNPTPIYFALAGARRVYACDVSPKAVAYVQEMAETAGVAHRISAFVCAGERLPLADATIDLVHGAGVLHHLAIPLAGAEISRVLRPGGKAGFKDPLGHNPVLELARDYLPYSWKKPFKGTDRPLKIGDIESFSQHFAAGSYRGFGLVSMLVTFLYGRKITRLKKFSYRWDESLLRLFPFLQRFCRFVVTCVQK